MNKLMLMFSLLAAALIAPTFCSADQTLTPSVQLALAKNTKHILLLGFSKEFLKGTMYLKTDLINPPQKFLPFEAYLAILFEDPKISKITKVKSGKYEGVVIKRPGQQSIGFLLNYDDGDLFPSHVVNGNTISAPETTMDLYRITLLILQLGKGGKDALTAADESAQSVANNAPISPEGNTSTLPPDNTQDSETPQNSLQRNFKNGNTEISEDQALQRLINTVRSLNIYNVPMECLKPLSLGFKNSGFTIELLSDGCPGMTNGQIVGRWRVDSRSGEAFLQDSGGKFHTPKLPRVS